MATKILSLAKHQTDIDALILKDTELQSKITTDITAAKSEMTTAIGVGVKEAKDYTNTKLSDLIGSAPETLDTLSEIATAVQSNKTVIDTLNSAIGTKANKSGGTFTGDILIPATTESTPVNAAATVQFVKDSMGNVSIENITGNAGTANKLKTPRLINGVAFDGSQNISITDGTKAPKGDNTTKLATTSFVAEAVTELGSKILKGTANFGGYDDSKSDMKPVTVTHSLNTTSYHVIITPAGIPDGSIGEFSVVKELNTIKVYNTGTSVAPFDYVIHKI